MASTTLEAPALNIPAAIKELNVRKRNMTTQQFDMNKIIRVLQLAMQETNQQTDKAKDMAYDVAERCAKVANGEKIVFVEHVQDIVEATLMRWGFLDTAKHYILYRESHRKMRDKHPISDEDKAIVSRNREYFPRELQIFQMVSKYARWIESKGRRETWEEICDRVIEYFAWHVTNHLPGVIITTEEWQELKTAMLRLDALPSMRMVQMAGPAARRCQVSIYNCAYLAIESLEDFSEMLYVLLQGTGEAFSVESDYTEDLPKIKKQKGGEPIKYVVDDSTEGWCDALLTGLRAWYNGEDCVFDVSKVRPAGTKLKTKGGRASGPGPLVDLLNFARGLILNRQGRRLRSIEVHDIACKIGKIVQVGGVRRAAELSLSDLDDDLMRHAKDGARWWETTPRAMANNSAVYEEKPDDTVFMSEWLSLAYSGSGERGIFNRGGVNKTIPKRRKKARFGCNPCGEIVLRSHQFCNLSIAVVRPEDTQESLARKVRLATIFGTLQATMTNFKYLRPIWKENCEEERLLGVDMIGCSDNRLTQYGFTPEAEADRAKFFTTLRDKSVIMTNLQWSERLGVNPSVATTCIKPSGNSSVLLHCGNSITGWYSKYMIRRVRGNAIDPVTQLLIEAGVPHFPEYDDPNPMNPSVWVFEFPDKAPDGAMTKDDISTIQQLENWKAFKNNWSEHNPSVTIYVGKNEWMEAGNWVLKNWDHVAGIAFMPRSEHVYPLAPLEAITHEEYEKRVAELPAIEWAKLSRFEAEDKTTVSLDYACSAGACERI